MTMVPTNAMMLHTIWLGSKPMPEECQRCLDSWRVFYPESTIVVHSDEALDEMDGRLRRQCNRAKTLSSKSDFLRFHLIHRYGGLYVDTDIEVRRRVELPSEFLVEEADGFVMTAFFRLPAGHLTVGGSIDYLRTMFDPRLPANQGSGPHVISRFKHFAQVVLPATTVDWPTVDAKYGLSNPDAPFCHYALGSWK